MQSSHIGWIKSNKESQVESLKKVVEDSEKKIAYHEENIEESFTLSEIKKLEIKDLDATLARIRKIQSLEDQLENKKRAVKKELDFYENNDHCPTCEQTITEDHKHSNITLKNDKLQKLEEGMEKLNGEFEKTNQRLIEIDDVQNQISELQQTMGKENVSINHLREGIKGAVKNIAALEVDRSDLAKENKKMASMEHQRAELVKTKQDVENELKLYDVASELLKDQGIKQRIVKQYVPIINKLVNKYLAAMDFFVNFELDEKFNEKILSRHRDLFTYNSFSEGEKMRIDLALLFTWRAIAKMKNSANTNLLMLDEVFDASLDNEGCDEFLKLIQELGSDTNAFVISHKGDILQDKFHNTLKFEKYKNFSRIAA
jgi:DNA repair exonuclease SbcCD ATPase subunit